MVALCCTWVFYGQLPVLLLLLMVTFWFCIHAACREPKVSELVRQKVLPHQTPSRYLHKYIPLNLSAMVCLFLNHQMYFNILFSQRRKTPVQIFYSTTLDRRLQSVGPTKGPPVLSQLPPGFHHLYSRIEYDCVSPYYQHYGSSRRTCLKTGKWSGRHVSCSPGEGSRAPVV